MEKCPVFVPVDAVELVVCRMSAAQLNSGIKTAPKSGRSRKKQNAGDDEQLSAF